MEQQDRERQERERQERERQERERLEKERQAAAGQETPALVNNLTLIHFSFVLFQRYTQINVQHMIALKGKLEFILRTKNNRGF